MLVSRGNPSHRDYKEHCKSVQIKLQIVGLNLKAFTQRLLFMERSRQSQHQPAHGRKPRPAVLLCGNTSGNFSEVWTISSFCRLSCSLFYIIISNNCFSLYVEFQRSQLLILRYCFCTLCTICATVHKLTYAHYAVHNCTERTRYPKCYAKLWPRYKRVTA